MVATILRTICSSSISNTVPPQAMAGDFAAPFFARWLSPEEASRAAEWAVRIVVTYLADPAPDTDLSDPEDTRALVRAFVMPGILALRSATTTSHLDPFTNAKKGAAQ